VSAPTRFGAWLRADDVNRLVREIDVALNGADAAPQASLCDIAGQVCKVSREGGPILQRLAASPKPAGAAPLPDRDIGGRIVREAWMRWALTQACPKPSWLVPYDDLSEADKEADRQIFEACAGRAPAAGGVPAEWREFVAELANTAGVQISGNWLSARAKSLLETLPKNLAAEPAGKCSWCGVLASIGAVIPDGRWVCSHDCHVLLSRAEGRGSVLKVPEGWQIARNVVGGIRIDNANGSWLSMPPTTPQDGHEPLAQRLLYGLAEALLSQPQLAHVEKSNSANADELLAGIGYPAVTDALGFSENFAEANPNLTQTAKDHILALCKIIRTIAPAAAQPTGGEVVRIKQNCPPPTWMFPDDDAPTARDRPSTPVGWSDSDWLAHLQLAQSAGLGEVDQAVFASAIRAFNTTYAASGNRPRRCGRTAEALAAALAAAGLGQGVSPELIERFRVAARALIGIRQPPAPEGQQRPVYAEDVETMADVLRVLEGLAQQPALHMDDAMKERLIDVAWDEYIRDGAGGGIVTAADMRRIVIAVITSITSHEEKGT